MAKLPRVLILYTGGTFGMDDAPGKKGGLSLPKLTPAGLKARFVQRAPELARLARCEVEILFNRDSAHVGPPEWQAMASRIRARASGFDGIVVLHGTDTLAYTASALSFLLRPCAKPVVITGAQRPLSSIRTDARRNLISAVEIAAHGPRELVRQVTVFFDGHLFQGNRVRKRSALDFDAFESPHAPPLAAVGTELRYAEAPRGRRRKGGVELDARFDRQVAVLRITPGFPAEAVAQGLLPRVSALVLVAFPSVTAPTHDPSFVHLLKRAREQGVPVVLVTEGVSELPSSRQDPSTYAAGRELMAEGCLWAGPMTVECAYVKATLLLGQNDGRARFAELWSEDLAGEAR